jgi:hypothetical protein
MEFDRFDEKVHHMFICLPPFVPGISRNSQNFSAILRIVLSLSTNSTGVYNIDEHSA